MPQVTARDLKRFRKSQGFVEARHAGGHLTLFHPERRIAVTVPMHSGDLGRGLVHRILRDAGFITQDYLGER